MVAFEAEFDIGEVVQHYVTKEKFVVRFVVFGSTGIPVYQCHPKYAVGRASDVYTFDEPELELIGEE
jgi:hypothetical protein